MPNFNLQPLSEDELNGLQPVERNSAEMQTAARAGNEAKLEQFASNIPWVGKPAAQLFNALGSRGASNPGNFIAGPINGLSKLGNALGDWAQNKPIDVSDAWQIPDEVTRRADMRRYTAPGGNILNGVQYDGGVTPADEAGRGIAEGLGGEIAGAYLTGGLSLLAKATGLVNKLQQSDKLRRAVTLANSSQRGRQAFKAGGYFAETLTSTTLATLFMDNSEGNLGNITQIFDPKAKPLPFGVDQDDDYLEATRKTVFGEGLLAPLAIFGIAMPIAPFRRSILNGDLPTAVQQMVDAEIAPYGAVAPQNRLPGMQGPQEPGGALAVVPPPEPGGAIVPYDSAISRGIDENLQVQQVVQQRQRLRDMGLVQAGRGNQLELTMPGVVDPGVKMQIRQLQTERGLLIKQGADEGALSKIDQQIDDLTMQGASPADQLPPAPDVPDGRPELDTYLAMLDEMSDEQLGRMLENVNGPVKEKQRQAKIEEAQLRMQDIEQRQLNTEARLAAGEITPKGATRINNKIKKELDAARAEVDRLQADANEPKTYTVGDQLNMQMQMSEAGPNLLLDKAFDAEALPPIKDFEFVELPDGTGMWRAKGTSERMSGGYQSVDDYREALMGMGRDVLRSMARPNMQPDGTWKGSPEASAILKAQTGRRVDRAKKADIVNALVELAQKRGRFVDLQLDLKVPMQDSLSLYDSTVGGEYSMLPKTAMNKAAAREAIKKELLQMAINNGEVQAPVTPLPNRPTVDYDQMGLIDDLLGDEKLAAAYAVDAVPTYRAGKKSTEAMLEEIRLRLDFGRLDGDALQMQTRAVLDAMNWDQMTWAQKQETGMLDTRRYAYQGQTLEFGTERLGFQRKTEVNWVKGGPEQEAAARLAANKPVVQKPGSKKVTPPKKRAKEPEVVRYQMVKGQIIADPAIAPPKQPKLVNPETQTGLTDNPLDLLENQPKAFQDRVVKQTMDQKRAQLNTNKANLKDIEAEMAELEKQQIGRSC